MAADLLFLDTSLLVSASIEPHPSHEAAASFLDRLLREGALTCISPQVCREFLSALTRQPVQGKILSADESLVALKRWTDASTMLDEDETVVAEWLRLVRKYQVRGKQVHDCNLVAVMRTYRVHRIATLNGADFQRFESEIAVEPIIS